MAVATPTLSPYTAPNYDVFSPARRSDPLGVILGAPLDGAQSYTPWIGLSTVRELALKHADKVGLVDEAKFIQAAEEFDRARVELRRAHERITELEAAEERIAGLVAAGYTVQKKVGRPAKKESS